MAAHLSHVLQVASMWQLLQLATNSCNSNSFFLLATNDSCNQKQLAKIFISLKLKVEFFWGF
jgi:hypothetical protein